MLDAALFVGIGAYDIVDNYNKLNKLISSESLIFSVGILAIIYGLYCSYKCLVWTRQEIKDEIPWTKE